MAKRVFLYILFTLFLVARSGLAWQQRVDYRIKVQLNTKLHMLQREETLIYTNQSPDTLHWVWFHLYPNAYRDNQTVFAREQRRMGSSRFALATSGERGYIEIDSLLADGIKPKREFKEDDGTELKVYLPHPLLPGNSLCFCIGFRVKIPHIFSRLGHKGRHYEITQWYPKIAVYDQWGWHPDGYHAIGEFYGEYGNFLVEITLPADMTVGATGELIGPPEEVARLNYLALQGANLDSLRARGEKKKKIKKIIRFLGKRREPAAELKTLVFRAQRVHDFAWFADARFILKRANYQGVTINVLVLPQDEERWKDVLEWVRDTLKYYGNWYGRYPYPQITVVDGSLAAGGGMEYPNVVVISLRPLSWTRVLEEVVMHEVGHQWFYGILGSNEMDEAWLDEGINTFSEIRYMEAKYGREENLFSWPKRLRFLPNIGDRWTQTFLYWLTATNGVEKSTLTPSYSFIDEPLAYQVGTYAKPAWMMFMLKYLVGDEVFDRIMQTYFRRYRFKHPHTEDFIAVAEEVSGQDLKWFFSQWLETTKTCDYAITKLKTRREAGLFKTEVVVERKGEAVMPIEVCLQAAEGEKVIQHWDGRGKRTKIHFQTRSRPKWAQIDPGWGLLEVDRWNNRKPQKVTIHPIFDFPDFDSYQIFYGPSLWFDRVDGATPGLWLQGRQFLDFGPFKGKNQWMLGTSWGIRSHVLNWKASYHTPLPLGGRWSRIHLQASRYHGRISSSVGLSWHFSPHLLLGPAHELSLKGEYLKVENRKYVYRDDWSPGKVIGPAIDYSFSFPGIHFFGKWNFSLKLGRKVWGGEYHFNKRSLELRNRLRWTRWLNVGLRTFTGYVGGSPPNQELFFLSGGTALTPGHGIIWEEKGRLSPQEHLFVSGDGNLRGYYGQHLKGKAIWAINLSLPFPHTPLFCFWDMGNVGSKHSLRSARMDSGIGMRFGPLRAQFPFWINRPPRGERKFTFRWLVDLNLRTLVSF